MFNKIEPLEHTKHKALRLSRISSFAFAGKVTAVKLVFSELRFAARYYPIVFLNEAPAIPQALFSLEKEKNRFVDASGNWTVPYIPAHIRLYPFTLGKYSDQADKFALCVDPEAEHFRSSDGESLFTDDGKPTEMVQNILTSLEKYQQEVKATQERFNLLDEKGLIVDKAIKYQTSQAVKGIDGFKGVDMEKLLESDDASLAGYVKNGLMGMVYEQNHSLSNFSKLVGSGSK